MKKRSSSSPECGSGAKENGKGLKGFPKVFCRTYRHSQSGNAQERKTRFAEPEFHRAVKLVLEYLGEETSFENYMKFDRIIDWEAFAENIKHPTKTALCHVLNGQGQIVTVQGRPVVVAREIVACSESEAAEILAKESKVFVKWWFC